MDYQNRVGGKTGTGGLLSQSEANAERRERLRKLALETIDLSKDPYFMKNHLGTFECRLCLTIHTNEGSYLGHTQGKRHQNNLARRAAREAAHNPGTALPGPVLATSSNVPSNYSIAPSSTANAITKKKFIKIGRPAYKLTKLRDSSTGALGLLIQLHLPAIIPGQRPRHRYMSAYEQRIEPPHKGYQYLVVAAEPYESVAFKIPARELYQTEDGGGGEMGCFTHWDADSQLFVIQILFRPFE